MGKSSFKVTKVVSKCVALSLCLQDEVMNSSVYVSTYYQHVCDFTDLLVGRVCVVQTNRSNQVALLRRVQDEDGIPTVQVCESDQCLYQPIVLLNICMTYHKSGNFCQFKFSWN